MSTLQMNHAIDPDSIPQKPSESRPYPPSFLNRFMDAVERLPIPYWLTYLLLFLLEAAIFHVLSWMDGWLPAYKVSPILLIFPLWLWAPLAIVTYLDSISLGALSSFAPLLDNQDEPMERLQYEFTNMPTQGVVIDAVIWAGIYCVFTYAGYQAFYVAYGLGPFLIALIILEGLVSYCIGGVIYYHSIRQLRLVNRTLKTVKQFNLFQLNPVYAFSVLTSRTGIAWVIMLSLTLLITPLQIATAPILVALTVQMLLAIAAFILPLQAVNHGLTLEKRRLLAEHQQRVESTLAQLHHCLDGNELGEVMQLNNVLTALNSEGGILAKIPTWPWPAGLFTGFLSIVVLPIVLFVIQVALGHWLSR